MEKAIRNGIFFLLLAGIFLAGSFWFLEKGRTDPEDFPLDSGIKISEKKEKNLSSFFENPKDYEDSFQKAGRADEKTVSAGIVSHHFLARDLIARFFSGIKNEEIETVIIAGPDHFNSFYGEDALLFTTKSDWETPFGKMEADGDMIGKILEWDKISLNILPFKNEHSIYALAPFVKKVFPRAKIVPLIARDNADYEKFMAAGERISEIAGNKAVLIVSSDFSHEATVLEAKKNDEESVKNLSNLNIQNIRNIICDCPNCLALTAGFLGNKKRSNFYLLENKTSADFGSTEEKLTSYVSGYWTD